MKKRLCFATLILMLICLFPLHGYAAGTALSQKKMTMKTSEVSILRLTGTNAKVKWTTSIKKRVSIIYSTNGYVVLKAKSKGTAKITAKVGKKKYICKVVVKKNAGIPKKLTLIVGDSFTFKRTGKSTWYIPAGCSKKISRDKKTCKLKFSIAGTVVLWATRGSRKYTCQVQILNRNGKKGKAYLTPAAGTNGNRNGSDEQVTWYIGNPNAGNGRTQDDSPKWKYDGKTKLTYQLLIPLVYRTIDRGQQAYFIDNGTFAGQINRLDDKIFYIAGTNPAGNPQSTYYQITEEVLCQAYRMSGPDSIRVWEELGKEPDLVTCYKLRNLSEEYAAWRQSWEKANITSGMSTRAIAEKVTRMVAENFDYGSSASGLFMYLKGSGSCWGSTEIITDILHDLGITTYRYYIGMGYSTTWDHEVPIIYLDGDWYKCEAGFTGSKPREYRVEPLCNSAATYHKMIPNTVNTEMKTGVTMADITFDYYESKVPATMFTAYEQKMKMLYYEETRARFRG